MDNWISQLSMGGLFVLFFGKFAVELVKALRNKINGKPIDSEAFLPGKLNHIFFKHIEETKDEYEMVKSIQTDVKWLKDVHNVKDEDGVPVWYVKTSLEKAITELSKNISAQTQVLIELKNDLKTLKRD